MLKANPPPLPELDGRFFFTARLDLACFICALMQTSLDLHEHHDIGAKFEVSQSPIPSFEILDPVLVLNFPLCDVNPLQARSQQ